MENDLRGQPKMPKGIYNRTENHFAHLKGRTLSEETKLKISISKKGKTAWNKGRAMSKATKNKMSLAKKGKYILEKNPFYGKTHSEKTRTKISEKLKGKPWKEKYIRKRIKSMPKGINHYNWKGGVTSTNRKLRNSYKWKTWRNKIFKRDDYTCQNPNCKYCANKKGTELHPHHIISLSENKSLTFDLDNGITYCKYHHLKSGLHKNIKNGVMV